MKIYILVYQKYMEMQILGVYASKEVADEVFSRRSREFDNYLFIEEQILQYGATKNESANSDCEVQ